MRQLGLLIRKMVDAKGEMVPFAGIGSRNPGKGGLGIPDVPVSAEGVLSIANNNIRKLFLTPTLPIGDTQAGFKVFKKESAHQLFPLARTKRFLFDLEILVIAKEHHCKIEKVYVDWQDRDGSTVRIFIDTLRSLRDLVLIYTRMLFGAYK